MNGLQEQVQRTLGSAYTVERELGGGGMSRVLLARDNALDRRVVVKVMPPELAAGVSTDRFRREIMLVAALQHPHIVGVLSAGEIDGLPYFIMPFVEGESLRAKIRRGPLAVVETVRILRDVARALAYAHERGIVHRDIKPDNVLISAGSAAVADFGVAKALSSALRTRSGERQGTLTLGGTSLGTPAYMAPEQAAADPATDHRADIYAFGVMAYEMLTGAPPFSGSTPQSLLAAQLTERPKPLGTHRQDVPAALAGLILRCLEKEPENRPQTAAEVTAALDDPAVISGAFASAPTLSAMPVAAGRRRVKTPALIAVGAAAVAVIAVATLPLLRTRTQTAEPTSPAAVAAPQPKSIAVLPLVNIGGDSTDAYLADGMTEEIINGLSRVPGLRVASRTASMSVRGQNATVADIGKQLNVATLLEGTMQRQGGRLRVTARLINVADGFMLWSDVYESEVKDVFGVQDELSKAIVSALGQELGAADTASASTERGATNVEAYNLYLRGRYFVQRRGEESLRKALDYFKRAIAADPRYAPAHAGVADVYALLPLYAKTRREELSALGLASANQALALDSTLVEAYAARGLLYANAWRWADAERDLRRAIALRPSYATAHQWLGEILLVNGSVADAVTELGRAAELDPVSPVIQASYAFALGIAGRRDESIARATQAADLGPEFYLPRMILGTVRLFAGQRTEAMNDLEMALALGNGGEIAKGTLGYGYAVTGERGKATALLRELEVDTTAANAQSAIARIHLGLADTAQALAALEAAAERHEPTFTSESLASPIYDLVRRDPRFGQVLRRLNLDVARLTSGR